MNFNDLALHLQHVNHYINTHIYSGMYFNPNLFVESVRFYLEMHQTESRKELANINKFNTFKVGTDQSKVALRLVVSTPQLAKDIQALSSAMLKDKIGEVKDGLPTSLTGSYVKTDNTNIDFYIYNASMFDFIPKSKLPKDTLNKYINEFKSRKQQPSDTITIKIPDKPMQQYWDYVFDLVGAFIGWCRGQWIWKRISKDKSNTELKFNNKPNDKVDLEEFYFHVSKQHNPSMNNAIDLINQKYNIQIDTKGHNHISESVLFEAYQTNYRKELAKQLHFDTFQVGTDPNKVSLKLIFPTSSDIQKYATDLLNSILLCKMGEVKDGFKNSLEYKLKSNNNELYLYIYNEFHEDLAENILNKVPINYKQIYDQYMNFEDIDYNNEEEKNKDLDYWYNIQDKMEKKDKQKKIIKNKNKNYKESVLLEEFKPIEYKYDFTIDKEINELKQKFDSMVKSASDTIVIDLSDPNKFNNIEEYWNYIFNVFVCFVGYTRGQWICKYVDEDNSVIYRLIHKYSRENDIDEEDEDDDLNINPDDDEDLREIKIRQWMPKYHHIEFNTDTTNVGDRGRYFHLNDDNFDKAIFNSINNIEKIYNIEIDIHDQSHTPKPILFNVKTKNGEYAPIKTEEDLKKLLDDGLIDQRTYQTKNRFKSGIYDDDKEFNILAKDNVYYIIKNENDLKKLLDDGLIDQNKYNEKMQYIKNNDYEHAYDYNDDEVIVIDDNDEEDEEE